MTSKEKKKYRRTEQWKELRNAVKKRDDNKCQICSKKKNLHVHHYKEYNYGEEYLSGLVTLCKSCHLLLERRLLRTKDFDIKSFCKNLERIYRRSKLTDSVPDDTYAHAVVVDIPPEVIIMYNNPSNERRTTVSIDKCLVEEIKHLWSKGIITGGCCCGHGAFDPNIIVSPESI